MKTLKNIILIGIILCFFGCTKTGYVGETLDGKRHGQGTMIWPDGVKYVGEFKENKKHGQGTQTWTNGDKYKREWKDDEMHGHGTYSCHARKVWDLKIQGISKSIGGTEGKYIFHDRCKMVGEFKEGIEYNTILMDNDGKIIEK